MALTVEAVIVIVGWCVSLLVALRAVPELAARRMCRAFGLAKVKLENGRTIYAVEDLEGNPVKIPIGTKEVDGEPQIVYGYAPLPMTMTYLAAEQAAIKVKMTLFNAKSQISKKMQKEGLSMAMQDGGSLDSLLPFLPKKAQMAAALLRAAGLGRGSETAITGQTTPTGSRGGSRAI